MLGACGDDARTGPPTVVDNDPAFTVTGVPRYFLAGDALTPATSKLAIHVSAPAGTDAVELWVDGVGPTALGKVADGFAIDYDPSALGVGFHGFVLAEPSEPKSFFHYDAMKGHALYVVVSNDWDDAYNTPRQIMLQEDFHAHHPHLVLTHLVGPYTFTDPALTEAQRVEMIDWVKGMRDSYGDEIGTHIHPYCNFVEAAGVVCKDAPSTVYEHDATGYTVRLGAYDYDEWMAMFAKVDELWAAHDMGKPTSFRAGGWTLSLDSMKALADSGYVADSSAVNWARMEEWQGVQASGGLMPAQLYEWNMAQWAPIGNTTQAYYSTTDSLLPGGTGAIVPVLEVTDNGILADYVLGQEMIDIFFANWGGGPIAAPTELSIGYHPPSIDSSSDGEAYWERIEKALTHIDGYLAVDGSGPAIYITMSQAATVWPAP